ncbi:NnrU protein [Halioglobus maricola]|uniref:NnrU protein n=1 Tax=Halioglobus maricola TaxID=2601894 RepID=A0A5P9NNG4_9GAMM|nr:NnrU family protein [Halioglobus maricola]QFU77370.1 NnrU protein [Halioglobus maricola]
MTLLTLGILLWAAVHFIPSLAQPVKQSLVGKLGENGYKGVFSLLMFTALALIIFGWRSVEEPTYYWFLPMWSRHLGMGLVLVAFILMGAAQAPTRLKQYVRHPQLTGVALWAAAHLLMNGDSRSVVLFGGLGLWAIIEMIAINRREGPWVKPEIPSLGRELGFLAISLAVFVAVALAHPWIAGVALF